MSPPLTDSVGKLSDLLLYLSKVQRLSTSISFGTRLLLYLILFLSVSLLISLPFYAKTNIDNIRALGSIAR